MNKTFAISILLLFFTAFNAAAQQVLTLEQTRQLAITHNEDLRIAAKQQEQARQQRAAARTLWLPSFSASGTGVYQDRDFEMEMILPTKVPDPVTGELKPNIVTNPNTGFPVLGPDGMPLFNVYAWLPLNISISGAYLLGVTMEQPLFTGGKILAGNRMAGIGMEMAAENISLQRMNTIADADQAYWTYISVTQQVKLARQAVEMLEEVVELARNSAEMGMVSQNDLLRAQVEQNKAELNLQKARNGLELSRMNLCRITGLPFDTPIIAADTIIDTNQPLPGHFGNIDIERRPEYRLLQQNIRMSEQNIRMTRADYLPTAGIQAGYNHVGGVEISGKDFDNTSFNVIGSVRIPLFHWGQGMRKVNTARIEMEMQQLELEKNSKLMQLEAEQARLNLLLALERIRMNETALEQAQENLRVSRDNYELGMETMSDYLMAQTQWQKAYSELIESRADYRIKETNWLRATGGLDK